MSLRHTRPSFDYTAAIADLCVDIVFRVPELRHIDMSRVAVSFAQTKHSEPFGVFASATPLRFEGGKLNYEARNKTWAIQRCFNPDGVEYLYILYFYVPRFIELKLSQKIETIVHELYHISPFFNGDVRRFHGRCYAHGSSRKKYDDTVRGFVDHWLKQEPSQKIWSFLRLNYMELIQVYGALHGTRIPSPKMVPVRE